MVGEQLGELGKAKSRACRACAGLRGGERDVSGGDALRPPGLKSEGSSLRSRSRAGGVSGETPPVAEFAGDIRGVGASVWSEKPWWCRMCAFRARCCWRFRLRRR